MLKQNKRLLSCIFSILLCIHSIGLPVYAEEEQTEGEQLEITEVTDSVPEETPAEESETEEVLPEEAEQEQITEEASEVSENEEEIQPVIEEQDISDEEALPAEPEEILESDEEPSTPSGEKIAEKENEWVMVDDGSIFFRKTSTDISKDYSSAESTEVPSWDEYTIDTVYLEGGISRIGARAFYNHTLSMVYMPLSVTYMGHECFGNGGSDENVNIYYQGTENDWNTLIANSDADLGIKNYQVQYESFDGVIFSQPADSEFSYYANDDGTITVSGYNKSDAVMEIPSEIDGKTVTAIADEAFENNSNLTDVTLPEGLLSIGRFAFANCRNLTHIALPDSLEKISDFAFNYCKSLTDVNFGSHLTEIGYDAFNMSGITKISIPASVTLIDDYAFSMCSQLTNITVSEENTVYDSRENCNALIETATNTLMSGSSNSFIPDGVKVIAHHAFIGRGINELTIPDSVTTIGDFAFSSSSLTGLHIPSSVTSIGYNPISSCTNLTSITVSESNTVFDSRNNCSGIIETATNTLICGSLITVIPDTVVCIGNNAFAEFDDLESISIPASVKTIKEGAFARCSSLKNVYYYGTEEQWNAIEKGDYNDPLLSAQIHYVSGETEQLAVPQNLRWRFDEWDSYVCSMSWDKVENADHYLVNIYHAETNELISNSTADEEYLSVYTDENLRTGSWYFTVQAVSDSADKYIASETAQSDQYTYGSKQVSLDESFLFIDKVNIPVYIPFTYTADGEKGDPADLSFAVDYEELEISVTESDSLSISAARDGDYEVSIYAGSVYAGRLSVTVRALNYSLTLTSNVTTVFVGKEYAFDLSYQSSEGEGDYMEIGVESDDPEIMEAALSDDHRQLIIRPLQEGTAYVMFKTPKYAGTIKSYRIEAIGPIPEEGPYLLTDMEEEMHYSYLQPEDFEEGYSTWDNVRYFVDGVEVTEELTFEFSDTDVAQVKRVRKGQVTYDLLGYGDTYLYVKYNDEVIFTHHLYVDRPSPDNLVPFCSSYTLKPGETQQLLFSVEPNYSQKPSNTWFESDHEEVATVDANGLVTAHAEGQAKITMTTEWSYLSLEYTITVSENAEHIVQSVEYEDFGKYRVTFKDGFLQENLPEKERITVNMISTDDKELYTFSRMGGYTVEGNDIIFEEWIFRNRLNRDENYLKTVYEGTYEWAIVIGENTYSIGNVRIARNITTQTPELTVSASDDNSVTIRCDGSDESCSVYMTTLYNNRYTGTSKWNGIYNSETGYTIIQVKSGSGLITADIPDTRNNEEYMIPVYENDTIVGFTIPGSVINKLGISSGINILNISTCGNGYQDSEELAVEFKENAESAALIPGEVSLSEYGILTFDLAESVYYFVELENYYGHILTERSGSAGADGKVVLDFAGDIYDQNVYKCIVHTGTTEAEAANSSVSYYSNSYYYGWKNLDTPINLIWNEDGTFEWDAVQFANRYEITLAAPDKDSIKYYTSETKSGSEYQKMITEAPDAGWTFSVRALGNLTKYLNSLTAVSPVFGEKVPEVFSEEIAVSVMTDGEIKEDLSNVYLRLDERMTEYAYSISETKKIPGIRFTAAGEYKYYLYLINDNTSILPNYDTYTLIYKVTQDNDVLTVSEPEIHDETGTVVDKIIFKTYTPKPAEYAPVVNVRLNNDPVTKEGLFTIWLKDDEGNIIQTKQNDSSGTVRFDNIEGLNDAMTYYFHIEAAPTEGYVFESPVRHLTIRNYSYKEDGTF